MDWTEWVTVYSEGTPPNDTKVQISFKLFDWCQKSQQSYYRINNEFQGQGSLTFKFDFTDCNGQVAIQNVTVSFDKQGILTNDIPGNWFPSASNVLHSFFDVKLTRPNDASNYQPNTIFINQYQTLYANCKQCLADANAQYQSYQNLQNAGNLLTEYQQKILYCTNQVGQLKAYLDQYSSSPSKDLENKIGGYANYYNSLKSFSDSYVTRLQSIDAGNKAQAAKAQEEQERQRQTAVQQQQEQQRRQELRTQQQQQILDRSEQMQNATQQTAQNVSNAIGQIGQGLIENVNQGTVNRQNEERQSGIQELRNDARHGKIIVTCPDCNGTGRVQCEHCSGTGYVECGACINGKVNCGACGGLGYRIVWRGRGQTPQEPCPMCGGTGKENCSICGGSGKQKCTECGGRGYTNCSKCSGTGKVSEDAPEEVQGTTTNYSAAHQQVTTVSAQENMANSYFEKGNAFKNSNRDSADYYWLLAAKYGNADCIQWRDKSANSCLATGNAFKNSNRDSADYYWLLAAKYGNADCIQWRDKSANSCLATGNALKDCNRDSADYYWLLAAKYGNADCIQWRERVANIYFTTGNALKDSNRDSADYYWLLAAKHGNADCIQWSERVANSLLATGNSLKDRNRDSADYYWLLAAKYGNADCIQWRDKSANSCLATGNALKDSNRDSAIYYWLLAAKYGNADCIQWRDSIANTYFEIANTIKHVNYSDPIYTSNQSANLPNKAIDSLMAIGTVQSANNQYEESIATFKEVEYINPEYIPAHIERAKVYMHQLKYAWANEFFKRALKGNPEIGIVHVYLAKIAKERKDYDSYNNEIGKAILLGAVSNIFRTFW